MIRFIIKVCIFFYGFGLFFLTIAGFHAAPFPRRAKKHFITYTISFFSMFALWLIGVSVTVSSPPQKVKNENTLYLANHGSYLDILILAAKSPCIFITSLDVRNEFFLGFLTRFSGCIFVNRKRHSEVKKDLNQISTALQDGFNVALFAEATSTNGEVILPFKSSLVKAALDAKRAIVPVCIKYHTINNQNISPETRDFIYYYGDMVFFPHLIRLLSRTSIHASIQFLKKTVISPDLCRKAVTTNVHKRITDTYYATA